MTMRYAVLFVTLFFVMSGQSQEYKMIVHVGEEQIVYSVEDVDSVNFMAAEDAIELDVVPIQGWINPLLSLKGKRVAFFGDSIMKGYVDGLHVTDYNFPYWLNAIFEFKQYDNFAVGGAKIFKGNSKYKSIREQIEEVNLNNYDVIFVAGGVNDYFGGCDLGVFKDAFLYILDHLSANVNPDCQIVFMTPINCAIEYFKVYKRYPTAELGVYSNSLIRSISRHSIRQRSSVIRGDTFGFPNYGELLEYNKIMFGDNVHPTELGYRSLFLTGFLRNLYNK